MVSLILTPAADLSDIDLDSFIVIAERRIEETQDLAYWAPRYVELVTERHARVMARGKAQAEELSRARSLVDELFEENS
jgi:hypothetical protein